MKVQDLVGLAGEYTGILSVEMIVWTEVGPEMEYDDYSYELKDGIISFAGETMPIEDLVEQLESYMLQRVEIHTLNQFNIEDVVC